jgi:predicted alpha/beta superfamily hydrolase
LLGSESSAEIGELKMQASDGRAIAAATALGLLVSQAQLRAQEKAGPPAFLADTKSWVMPSAVSKRAYQISVALPNGYSREHSAYPVLYAADANGQFGIVVETARLLSLLSRSKEIPDLVIVGIGYPKRGQGFHASGGARVVDLTPTPDPDFVRDNAKNQIAEGMPPGDGSGGAPQFLAFIRSELVPAIERRYNVSRTDRAWFGHSLGGLFGVYAMFNNDGLFKRLIIGSPSLWWNDKAILSIEESFARSGKPLPIRAFFSVGLLEPQLRMVVPLREFTERLKSRNYNGLEFQVHYFDDETHVSGVPATISRGLRFIYSAPTPETVPQQSNRLSQNR